MSTKLPWVVAFSVTVLEALSAGSGARAQMGSEMKAQTPVAETGITRMNDQFRRDYAQERTNIKEASFPVIVANGDKIILMRKDSRDERNFIPAAWSVLKSVDHVPLALFVLLESKTDKPLSEETLSSLAALRTKTAAARPEVLAALTAEPLLGPAAVTRNGEMLDRSLTFMDAVLERRTVTSAQVALLAASMSRPSMLNADDAEILELTLLDKAVQGWHTQLTAGEWQKLRIVVMGGHMPREQDRRMQYFSMLLNQKREGARIVYVEGIDDVDKALDLMATHILDERIAEAYFRDPWRMHRDLLSDSARRYLVKHPPQRSLPR